MIHIKKCKKGFPKGGGGRSFNPFRNKSIWLKRNTTFKEDDTTEKEDLTCIKFIRKPTSKIVHEDYLTGTPAIRLHSFSRWPAWVWGCLCSVLFKYIFDWIPADPVMSSLGQIPYILVLPSQHLLWWNEWKGCLQGFTACYISYTLNCSTCQENYKIPGHTTSLF